MHDPTGYCWLPPRRLVSWNVIHNRCDDGCCRYNEDDSGTRVACWAAASRVIYLRTSGQKMSQVQSRLGRYGPWSGVLRLLAWEECISVGNSQRLPVVLAFWDLNLDLLKLFKGWMTNYELVKPYGHTNSLPFAYLWLDRLELWIRKRMTNNYDLYEWVLNDKRYVEKIKIGF